MRNCIDYRFSIKIREEGYKKKRRNKYDIAEKKWINDRGNGRSVAPELRARTDRDSLL